MAHIIQLAVGVFVSCLGVKGSTKSWEAYEHDQQFAENESIEIGKSQRLREADNARINTVCAMRPGLAKIIEKVCISRYFESPEADLQYGENDCLIDYSDTWLPKWVYWLSQTKVRIADLPIIDVKILWHSTQELLKWACRLWEFSHEWFKNP